MASPDNNENSLWNDTRPFLKDVVKALKKLEKSNGSIHGHTVKQISAWMREHRSYAQKDNIEPRIRTTLRTMAENYVVIRKEEKRILWKMSGYCKCTKCSKKTNMPQNTTLLCDPSPSSAQGNTRFNQPIALSQCRSRSPVPRSRGYDRENLLISCHGCGVAVNPNSNNNFSGDYATKPATTTMGSTSLQRRSSKTTMQGSSIAYVCTMNGTNASTNRHEKLPKSSYNEGEKHIISTDGCRTRAISSTQKRRSSGKNNKNDSTDPGEVSSPSRPKRPNLQENQQSSVHGLRATKCKRDNRQGNLQSTSAECTSPNSQLGVSTSGNNERVSTARTRSNNYVNNSDNTNSVERNNHNNDTTGDDHNDDADVEDNNVDDTDIDVSNIDDSNIGDDYHDGYQVIEANNGDDIDANGNNIGGNLVVGDTAYNNYDYNDIDEEEDYDPGMCRIM